MSRDFDIPEDLKSFPEDIVASPLIETPYHERGAINNRLQTAVSVVDPSGEPLPSDPEHERIVLVEAEKEKLHMISNILNDPKLGELIEAGKITVALVKPHVHKGKIGESDGKISNQILRQEIKDPLKIVLALPVHMTMSDVEDFYASIKDMLSNKPDPETSGKTSVWERHARYMSSGAVTMILLYSAEGNAVQEWRRQLGPTSPEKDTEGKTIRGRYGWDIRGNVCHGSDGNDEKERVDNVKHEAGWMKRKVDKMLAKGVDVQSDPFLNELALRRYGILQEGEVFLGVEQFIHPTRISAIGATFSAYLLSFVDKDGKITSRRFISKTCDNDETMVLSQCLVDAELTRMNKFKNVFDGHKSPVSVPKVYASFVNEKGAAVIVRDFVSDHNKTVADFAKSKDFMPLKRRVEILSGLIYAAAMLDVKGIPSRNLFRSFLYDGKSWNYIGSPELKLESAKGQKINTGLADLLQEFGDDDELAAAIRRRYQGYVKTIRKEIK